MREIGGFVKVKVKEGCRLQATGYRVVRVESGKWKGFWGREPVPKGFGEGWLAGGRVLTPFRGVSKYPYECDGD